MAAGASSGPLVCAGVWPVNHFALAENGEASRPMPACCAAMCCLAGLRWRWKVARHATI